MSVRCNTFFMATTQASDAVFQFRITTKDKEEFSAIAESYGLRPSQFFRMIVRQTNRTKKLPVSFDDGHVPNAETAAILSNIDKLEWHTLDDPRDILKW